MTGSEDSKDSQWFKDWAKEHGLSWKTTGALRKRDCANKETLCSLHDSDLSDMLTAEKITFGQFRLLSKTLEELRKPSPSPGGSHRGGTGTVLPTGSHGQ